MTTVNTGDAEVDAKVAEWLQWDQVNLDTNTQQCSAAVAVFFAFFFSCHK